MFGDINVTYCNNVLFMYYLAKYPLFTKVKNKRGNTLLQLHQFLLRSYYIHNPS